MTTPIVPIGKGSIKLIKPIKINRFGKKFGSKKKILKFTQRENRFSQKIRPSAKKSPPRHDRNADHNPCSIEFPKAQPNSFQSQRVDI